MNRLIDTMGYDEMSTFIDYLASAEADLNEPEMRQELEKLFAPAPPNWSDSLEEEDNQTWVLCFVSDDSTKDTRDARWITSKVYKNGSTLKDSTYEPWEYATPVDLGLRYNRGDK